MRDTLSDEVERRRTGGAAKSGPDGTFELVCPETGRTLFVVVSDGRDWFEPVRRPPEPLRG